MLACGCGREPKSPLGVQKASITQAGASFCPMVFPKAGLCAKIHWVNGPSSEQASSFVVSFWRKDSGSDAGPFIEPAGSVGAYLRMKCCGSLFFPKVKKTAEGVYLVSDAQFSDGKWEVFVQIKSSAGTEKSFVPVTVGE